MNEYKYTPIKMTPFKWFVLENFPFIEEDFDSLTPYGLWCKLKEDFDKVANKTNEMGTQVESFTNAFIQLKDYVDNYFKNLDVQEEINNKLDDMAQDGTLQEIINAYLQSNCIWGFNTINDMLQATNLINGSKCRTLGYYEKNDGGSGLYLIRNRTFEDVIDNGYLHLVRENLVAELIIQNDTVNVKQFGSKGDAETDDTQKIQNAINSKANIIIINNGNFLITDEIFIPDNKVIIGENSIILKGTTKATFKNKDYDTNVINKNITLKNINMKNNDNVQGSFIRFYGVNNIILENIKLKNDTELTQANDGAWAIYIEGENVNINNIEIDTYNLGLWGDGIHFGHISNLELHNFNIQSGDDCIALHFPKSRENEKYQTSSSNINISNGFCKTKSASIIRVGANDGINTTGTSNLYNVYKNVKISDIVYSNGTNNSKLISFEDQRSNLTEKHDNIIITNLISNDKLTGNNNLIRSKGSADNTNNNYLIMII